MPLINGQKVACEPCIRGHRSTKCQHMSDRIMIAVRKPGRPLANSYRASVSALAKDCHCRGKVSRPAINHNCSCANHGGVAKSDIRAAKAQKRAAMKAAEANGNRDKFDESEPNAERRPQTPSMHIGNNQHFAFSRPDTPAPRYAEGPSAGGVAQMNSSPSFRGHGGVPRSARPLPMTPTAERAAIDIHSRRLSAAAESGTIPSPSAAYGHNMPAFPYAAVGHLPTTMNPSPVHSYGHMMGVNGVFPQSCGLVGFGPLNPQNFDVLPNVASNQMSMMESHGLPFSHSHLNAANGNQHHDMGQNHGMVIYDQSEQHCVCGDSCQCIGCSDHPTNQANLDYCLSLGNAHSPPEYSDPAIDNYAVQESHMQQPMSDGPIDPSEWFTLETYTPQSMSDGTEDLQNPQNQESSEWYQQEPHTQQHMLNGPGAPFAPDEDVRGLGDDDVSRFYGRQ